MSRRWSRELIALAVSFALLAAPSSAGAAASPTPGKACAPHKSTRVVAGLKYTCIINTKAKAPKYVWSKGVRVNAAPTSSPSPNTELSISNLDTSRVRSTAYDAVLAEIASSSTFVPTVTYVLGPSLTVEQKQRELRGLETTAAFWSNIYKPLAVSVAYFNASDVDVIDGLACTIAQYCQQVNGSISSMIRRDTARNGGQCNSAFATQYSPTQQLFAQCLGPGNDDVKNRQTTPHEYTHFAQQATFHMKSPNWFIEGSAAYFGGAIGTVTGGAGRADLDHMYQTDSRNLKDQSFIDLTTVTADGIERVLREKWDSPIPNDGVSLARINYYPGALATEVMVALWGITKLKHFMTQIEPAGFAKAFEAEYGLTLDVFYPAVSKYIAAMYAIGK